MRLRNHIIIYVAAPIYGEGAASAVEGGTAPAVEGALPSVYRKQAMAAGDFGVQRYN